jgi:glyoxylase-like metal-dependent hydrolase (beta-lactamase superfamily II)
MLKLALAAVAALMTSAALAQPSTQPPPPPLIDWEKVQIKTTDLGHNTYRLEGQGGNITIAVGTDGIIMVDSQFAPLSDKIKAAIKAISPLPVKYLINTHFHGDHTGGNANFAKDGAIVVAHDNIRVRLAAGSVSQQTGQVIPAVPPEGLPKQTYFGGSFALEVGGRKAQLTYIANAHTDGDTWVYFADANVLCTGDTVNNLKRYQSIDYRNGGDVRGMIRAGETYLKVANDDTKVVVGHGPLANKKDVQEFHDMLVASRDRIKPLFDAGKTEAEVLALDPLKELNEKWAAGNPQLGITHTRNVYHSFERF